MYLLLFAFYRHEQKVRQKRTRHLVARHKWCHLQQDVVSIVVGTLKHFISKLILVYFWAGSS